MCFAAHSGSVIFVLFLLAARALISTLSPESYQSLAMKVEIYKQAGAFIQIAGNSGRGSPELVILKTGETRALDIFVDWDSENWDVSHMVHLQP